MKELTAFDVSNLVKESQILVNGKIDNIYQIEKKDLYLQIYTIDKVRHLLRIIAGKAFYLIEKRPEFPENLQRFCSYLRKYIANARIKSIEQEGYERILKIKMETKEGSCELVTELFGKGNFIFIKNDKMAAVLEEQIWADRNIKPGIPYVYPNKTDSKKIFEKYKKEGALITMNMLDKELSGFMFKVKATAKEKEIKRIKTIIEKQTQNLSKVLKQAEENKRKGELIYEHYQELHEKVKNAKGKMVVDLK